MRDSIDTGIFNAYDAILTHCQKTTNSMIYNSLLTETESGPIQRGPESILVT